VRRLRQLFHDQSGASAVEYGLMLVLAVALGFAIVHFFGHTLNTTRDVTGAVDNSPIKGRDAGPSQSGGGVDAGFIRRGVNP
jgi:Flp pilus assembly pilin Flp